MIAATGLGALAGNGFAQYPNQPGTNLNVGHINYGTLRMQEALERLQNIEKYHLNQ